MGIESPLLVFQDCVFEKLKRGFMLFRSFFFDCLLGKVYLMSRRYFSKIALKRKSEVEFSISVDRPCHSLAPDYGMKAKPYR